MTLLMAFFIMTNLCHQIYQKVLASEFCIILRKSLFLLRLFFFKTVFYDFQNFNGFILTFKTHSSETLHLFWHILCGMDPALLLFCPAVQTQWTI